MAFRLALGDALLGQKMLSSYCNDDEDKDDAFVVAARGKKGGHNCPPHPATRKAVRRNMLMLWWR
jgi:hypothetical protein